jgi:ATP-dependent Clp protease protease subunit
LRGKITKQIASCCIARLLILATEDPSRPIVVYIDSSGGSIIEALGVISTINGIRCPVVTFCHGQAVGPAALVAAHGLRGYRVGTAASRFSFKGLEVAGKGKTPAELEAVLPMFVEILAAAASKSKDQVQKWLKDGAQFNSQEALANGLIDAVSAQPLYPPH